MYLVQGVSGLGGSGPGGLVWGGSGPGGSALVWWGGGVTPPNFFFDFFSFDFFVFEFLFLIFF